MYFIVRCRKTLLAPTATTKCVMVESNRVAMRKLLQYSTDEDDEEDADEDGSGGFENRCAKASKVASTSKLAVLVRMTMCCDWRPTLDKDEVEDDEDEEGIVGPVLQSSILFLLLELLLLLLSTTIEEPLIAWMIPSCEVMERFPARFLTFLFSCTSEVG